LVFFFFLTPTLVLGLRVGSTSTTASTVEEAATDAVAVAAAAAAAAAADVDGDADALAVVAGRSPATVRVDPRLLRLIPRGAPARDFPPTAPAAARR
jgi:hypothetical protein